MRAAQVLATLWATGSTLPASVHAAADPHVVYLNFSTGKEAIVLGPEDPANNRSTTCQASPFGRWDGAQDCGDREQCRRVIAGHVQSHWNDFNVVITTVRPDPAIPYSMAMIGPMSGTCTYPMGVGGIAPLDCGNRVEGNVSFSFLCDRGAADCALVISQEQAHTFGLGHTDDDCDIMYPTVSRCPSTRAFADKSNTASGNSCSGATQNSYQTLKAVLGAWPPGVDHPRDWETCRAGPPSVIISSPLDGDCVAPSFTLTATVSASCPLLGVTAEIPAASLAHESRSPPFEWAINGLADGDYVIRVVAQQTSDPVQSADAVIAVHVGTCSPAPLVDRSAGCACGMVGSPAIDAAALAGLALVAIAWDFARSARRARRGPWPGRARHRSGHG